MGVRKVADLLYASKLIWLWNHIAYEKDRKHPTQSMKRSKRYFDKSKKRINSVVCNLADLKSQVVYLNCIRYRETHDYRTMLPLG